MERGFSALKEQGGLKGNMQISNKIKLVLAFVALIVFQITINLLLLDLSNQSEANLKGVEQARLIAEKLKSVKEDMHGMITLDDGSTSSSPDQMPATIKKWYEHISADFSGLETACADQPELHDRIVKMQAEIKKCVSVAGVVQSSFFESASEKRDATNRSWKNIRYFAGDLVDADFQVLDRKARARVEASTVVQANLRERTRHYLIAAVVIDLLLVALIVILARRQTL